MIPRGVQKMYVRYVGQTSGLARTQHAGDLYDRKKSFFVALIKATRRLFQEMIQHATVHEFSDLALSNELPASGAQLMVEDFQRVLIAHFGKQNLLNQQSRGFNVSYQRSAFLGLRGKPWSCEGGFCEDQCLGKRLCQIRRRSSL